jgi:hypothetical protein
MATVAAATYARTGMSRPDFFLAMTDSCEPGIRRCRMLRFINSPTRADLLLVSVAPPLVIEVPSLHERALDTLVLAPHYVGDAWRLPLDRALHVYVVNLKHPANPAGHVTDADLEPIAWATVYPSEEEARSGVEHEP